MQLPIVETIETLTGLLENVFVPLLAAEIGWLVWRRRMGWARIKEMLGNASSLVVLIPAGIAGVVLWYGAFDAIHGLLPWSISTSWWSAVAAVVAADFTYYWEHRFEHEHRLPWDLYHSVHHSSPQFDQTTSLRLSGFDALLTLGYLTPLVVLGFSPALVLAAAGLVVGYQTWIHTELIDRMPAWFEAVFNTPSHHRAHHGADRPYLDVNYGGILIVWDRLFGTFQPELDRPRYGLTTPIDSSNPLDIQFSELSGLVRDLRADDSWSTRLRRLWNRPGWQPTPAAASPSPAAR